MGCHPRPMSILLHQQKHKISNQKQVIRVAVMVTDPLHVVSRTDNRAILKMGKHELTCTMCIGELMMAMMRMLLETWSSTSWVLAHIMFCTSRQNKTPCFHGKTVTCTEESTVVPLQKWATCKSECSAVRLCNVHASLSLAHNSDRTGQHPTHSGWSVVHYLLHGKHVLCI